MDNRKTAGKILNDDSFSVEKGEDLYTILQAAPIGMLVFDEKLDLVFSNAYADEMFGWRPAEKVGMKCGDFIECINRREEPELCGETSYCPDCGINQALRHAFMKDSFPHLSRGESVVHIDHRTEPVYLSFRVNTLEMNGKKRAVLALYDITEQKEAEKVLRAASEEKRQLLREMNHRIKNNLGLVSALINLKQDELGDVTDLTDVRNQVFTIGLIHEKLSSTDGVKEVDPDSYITELLNSIFSLFSGKNITVNTSIEIESLPTKTAVVCGLILNELATNAMKYGFQDKKDPRFEVRLSTDVEGFYVLTVSNSGGPLVMKGDGEETGTLGLKLVRTLVEQLKGSLELKREPFPLFMIRFPVE